MIGPPCLRASSKKYLQASPLQHSQPLSSRLQSNGLSADGTAGQETAGNSMDSRAEQAHYVVPGSKPVIRYHRSLWQTLVAGLTHRVQQHQPQQPSNRLSKALRAQTCPPARQSSPTPMFGTNTNTLVHNMTKCIWHKPYELAWHAGSAVLSCTTESAAELLGLEHVDRCTGQTSAALWMLQSIVKAGLVSEFLSPMFLALSSCVFLTLLVDLFEGIMSSDGDNRQARARRRVIRRISQQRNTTASDSVDIPGSDSNRCMRQWHEVAYYVLHAAVNRYIIAGLLLSQFLSVGLNIHPRWFVAAILYSYPLLVAPYTLEFYRVFLAMYGLLWCVILLTHNTPVLRVSAVTYMTGLRLGSIYSRFVLHIGLPAVPGIELLNMRFQRNSWISVLTGYSSISAAATNATSKYYLLGIVCQQTASTAQVQAATTTASTARASAAAAAAAPDNQAPFSRASKPAETYAASHPMLSRCICTNSSSSSSTCS